VIGRNVELIFTEEDRRDGVPAQELRRALAEGSASDDRVHQRRDGRRFWASGSVMPMHDAGRGVVGFVKILRDETAARDAQEAIAAGRVHLLHALEDKERARAELEAADVAKDRFLAVLSHELRNPLAAISAASAAFGAAQRLDDETAVRARGILQRQVNTMRSLLDDLLDISRLRLGRLDLKRRRSALAAIVAAAVEAARPSIDQRQHVLAVNLPEAPVELDVDPTRISQVISNLLVNAAKYTPQGGHIALDAEASAADVTITVSDNGRGLNAEALESLFEMFWRAPDLDSSSGPSMGIGLSLARNIIALHGGTLQARSDGPGKGSSFIVRLPIAGASLHEGGKPEGDAAAAATHVRNGDAPLRVLLVDDNEDIVWTEASVLAARGFEVRTAVDGLQALEAMEQFRPDVAVLDIAMPGMDGREVARRVRREPWGRDMLLIAATGWGSDDDRRRSLEAGFDDHLVKPIGLEELLQRVASERRAPGADD